MTKFIAAEAVEKLEYDFTEFGGGTGVIPEPSTGAVNQFFKDTKKMIREVRALQQTAESLNVEGMTEQEVAEQIGKIDEATEGATQMQSAMVENIAILCGADRFETKDDDGNVIESHVEGGSPTFEELNRLPHRVLQAFSQWLMDQIRPKKTTPDYRG